jgi:hypothetical protein
VLRFAWLHASGLFEFERLLPRFTNQRRCYDLWLISQLPDGTNAGLDIEHELFGVQHHMKLVSILLFLSMTMLTVFQYACFATCVS